MGGECVGTSIAKMTRKIKHGPIRIVALKSGIGNENARTSNKDCLTEKLSYGLEVFFVNRRLMFGIGQVNSNSVEVSTLEPSGINLLPTVRVVS